jgi:hypothetical protein
MNSPTTYTLNHLRVSDTQNPAAEYSSLSLVHFSSLHIQATIKIATITYNKYMSVHEHKHERN